MSVQPQSGRRGTLMHAQATLMMTELIIVGRNPLDARQHTKRVSEKSLMQCHADSPAHRQPVAMIRFTVGPLPLSLLHNRREWTCMYVLMIPKCPSHTASRLQPYLLTLLLTKSNSPASFRRKTYKFIWDGKFELQQQERDQLTMKHNPYFFLSECLKSKCHYLLKVTFFPLASFNHIQFAVEEALHLLILVKMQQARCCLESLVLSCVFISGQIIEMAIVNPLHLCGKGRKETSCWISAYKRLLTEWSVLYGSLPFLSSKLRASERFCNAVFLQLKTLVPKLVQHVAMNEKAMPRIW